MALAISPLAQRAQLAVLDQQSTGLLLSALSATSKPTRARRQDTAAFQLVLKTPGFIASQEVKLIARQPKGLMDEGQGALPEFGDAVGVCLQ